MNERLLTFPYKKAGRPSLLLGNKFFGARTMCRAGLLFAFGVVFSVPITQAATVTFYDGTIYKHTKTYDAGDPVPTDPGFTIANVNDLIIVGQNQAARAAGAFDGNANVATLVNLLNGIGSVSTNLYASDPKKDDYDYKGQTYDLSADGLDKGLFEIGYLVSDPLNTAATDRDWVDAISGELNFSDDDGNIGDFVVNIPMAGTYAFTLKASNAFAVYLFEGLDAGEQTFQFDTRYTLGGSALSNSFHVFSLDSPSGGPSAVPEPSALVGLASMGLLGLMGFRRRKR